MTEQVQTSSQVSMTANVKSWYIKAIIIWYNYVPATPKVQYISVQYST